MRYFGGFNSVDSVIENFSSRDGDYNKVNDVDLKDSEVLLASYGGGSYDGAAIVIFARDGKYYEAHGSHCSCNGLEGQWSPEETSMEALMHRLENADLGSMREEHGDEFVDAFRRLVLFEIFEREVLIN